MNKKHFQLLVLDLDGTLICNNSISKSDIVSLLKLKNDGVDIIFATGRTWASAKPYVERFELKLPQIVSNGSVIVDPSDSSILWQKTIRKDEIIIVSSFLLERGVTPVIATSNNLIAQEPNIDTEYLKSFGGPSPIFLKEFPIGIKEPANLIMAICKNKKEKYEKTYLELYYKFGEQLNVTKSTKYFIEIMNKESSKRNALVKIVEMMNFSSDKIVGIGDGNNDLEFLEYVGYSVAMGNSPNTLKIKSNKITTSCEENGVSNAIKDIFYS